MRLFAVIAGAMLAAPAAPSRAQVAAPAAIPRAQGVLPLTLQAPTAPMPPDAADAERRAAAPLTLPEVVDRFLRRNLAVEAARHRVDVARAARIASRLRPNPTVTFLGNQFALSGPTPFSELYEVSATYAQPIEWPEKRRLRREVGDLTVSVAEAQLADVLRQRLADVKRAFYEAMLAANLLELARENRQSFDDLVALNQARFEEGAIAEGELLKVKLERVKFDTAVAQAQLAARQATIRLLALIDAEDVDSATPVAGDLAFTAAPLDLGALRARALQTSTAVQVAERGVGLAERRIGLEQARVTPEPTPFLGYQRVGPDNAILFGVSVPLPLFDRNQGGIAQARAEAGLARTELTQARIRILAEVESAFRGWESARDRVVVFERGLLAQADDSRAITLAAYQEGAVTLLAVLEAERARTDIRQQYLQALFDFQASLVLLDALTGLDVQP
jgi:cobalt-zinc-cadmium efflux system outer membrane protein